MSAGAPPGWVADDRLARAAWSRLAEPADPVAGAALAVLGASAALVAVLRGAELPDEVLELVEGRDPRRRAADALDRWRVRLPVLAPERDVATVERLGGRLVVPTDAEWPGGLDDLRLAAPACLWVLGPVELADATRRSVALVGSRAASAYGEHVAGELGAGLPDRGVTVVSGGAFGIDATAHRGALAVDGCTVAVLACGVDRYYPQAHEGLLRRIAAEGAVVAEVPPGSMPSRWRFLERNRLIAAITGATVVVEAAWRSGALSTASRAAGLQRRLGAVPGPVTSATSAGCHRLLREYDATCVTDAAEVAELVLPIGAGLESAPSPGTASGTALLPDGLPEADARVLESLPVRTGVTVASLTTVAGMTEPEVSAALGRLELLALVSRGLARGERVWRRATPRRTRGA